MPIVCDCITLCAIDFEVTHIATVSSTPGSVSTASVSSQYKLPNTWILSSTYDGNLASHSIDKRVILNIDIDMIDFLI